MEQVVSYHAAPLYTLTCTCAACPTLQCVEATYHPRLFGLHELQLALPNPQPPRLLANQAIETACRLQCRSPVWQDMALLPVVHCAVADCVLCCDGRLCAVLGQNSPEWSLQLVWAVLC